MIRRRSFVAWGLVAVTLLLVAALGGSSVAGAAMAGRAAASSDGFITIPYAGQLTDAEGRAVADGSYALRFTLYDDPLAGSALWSEMQEGIEVRDGALAVLLGSANPIPASVGAAWLSIAVRGPGETEFTDMAPRLQVVTDAEVTVAGSAAMTCPHDHMGETWTGMKAFTVRNNKPIGAAVGIAGVHVPTGNYAELGTYLEGLHAVGFKGPGIYAQSADNDGVSGETSTAGRSGVYGNNKGSGYGVFGHSATGVGVQGETESSYGVFGRSTTGDGIAGEAKANNKSGVFGYNLGGGFGVFGRGKTGPGVKGYSTDGHGTVGESANSAGVFGKSSTNVGVYGEGPVFGVYSNGDAKVDGNLFVSGNIGAGGSKAGYVVDIAYNADGVTLEQGDVVVISGVGPAELGEIPLIEVRRATTAQDRAVVGVVDQRYESAPEGMGKSDDEPITPGERLTVVTLGAFAVIKVDASFGAIGPGDLLVASSNPGHAMRADTPSPGTVIGKALGELAEGVGVIPVLVTLQ